LGHRCLAQRPKRIDLRTHQRRGIGRIGNEWAGIIPLEKLFVTPGQYPEL